MITDKSEAIKLIINGNVNFEDFDKNLLRDKDVALAYMQHNSSNNVLVKNFPIDIDVKGMIDDVDFILDVIKNLDIDYDKNGLISLLKYSTSCIIKNKMSDEGDLDTNQLKDCATQILTKYNDMVKIRAEELSKKQKLLDEVKEHINHTQLDGFTNADALKPKNAPYKNCNIGFTAEF